MYKLFPNYIFDISFRLVGSCTIRITFKHAYLKNWEFVIGLLVVQYALKIQNVSNMSG